MALPRGAMGLSAVCDCGISRSYLLTIFHKAWNLDEFLICKSLLIFGPGVLTPIDLSTHFAMLHGTKKQMIFVTTMFVKITQKFG